MEITEMLLTPNKYSRPQIPLRNVSKIAVHYIGNPNTTARANRNYFNNLASTHSTYASSHYIIGMSGEVIRCVPENEIAYCTNQANSYSISIECCHPKADGIFTPATRQSLTELCADLCVRHGLDPVTDIIRHYDVTGKLCPLCWVNDLQDFLRFKKEVKNHINDHINKKEVPYMEELKKLEARIQALENSGEKVFENIDDVPQWGRATVEKLVKAGALKGDGDDLDLSYTLLRLLVINDRAGVYDTKVC